MPMKQYLLILLIPIIAVLAYNTPQVKAFVKQTFKTQVSLQAAKWDSVDGAVAVIKQTLETGDKDQLAEDLYALMTSDFKEIFSWDDFKKGITDVKIKVLSTKIINQTDEFAEVEMRLESGDAQKDFTVYLKKENSRWKIFATEELYH